MILLEDVSKSYDGGATYAVRDLSLEVLEGETLVLLGSSGAGKTTALKLINRLVEPTSGRIKVGGRDVLDQDPTELRRRVGYVFQGIGLFPNMTVEENVEIVPRLLGWPSARRRDRARELLHLVGLPPGEYALRFPDELSGGQRQRVGVARALAADPDVLLMDEPFGALDARTRDTLEREVVSLKKELGKTIVFVTHDIFEAFTVGDRMAILHEGGLEQIGRGAEILESPATTFVRELLAKPAEKLRAFGALFEAEGA